MKRRVFICSTNESYRNYLAEVIHSVDENCFIHLSDSQRNLFENILDIENTFVICDKYFLGIKISPKIKTIKKLLCRGSKILVTAWNVKEIFFPLRLKNLGVDGFIKDIGETENFARLLKYFFDKGTCYSEDVESTFLSKGLSEYNKYTTDVSDQELENLILFSSSGSTKDVDGDENSKTVASRIHSFKKKMGIVSDSELSELLTEIKRGGLI